MKNKLTDLNDYLFEALEKIQTAENPAELKDAIAEGRAVATISTAIIRNAGVQFQAYKFVKSEGLTKEHDPLPEIISYEYANTSKVLEANK